MEEAQEFTCEPEMKVYWMHNTLTDKVEFMCAAEYPASGSYLPLAEILADGTVSNVRKSARAKLPGMVSDYNRSKKIRVDKSFYFNEQPKDNSFGYATTCEFDLYGNNFKWLLFVCQTATSWAIIDLETGICRNTYLKVSGGYRTEETTALWNESQPAESSSPGDTSDFRLSLGGYYSGQADKDVDFDILSISEEGILTLKIIDMNLGSPGSKNVAFDIYAF